MQTDSEDLRNLRLPRGRHGLPRELVTGSQRARLMRAGIEVTAERGYEATTVADLLECSGVGRETFYELFADKHECLLVAHSALVDDLESGVREAYRTPGPWVAQMVEALAWALEWFAADPLATRFMLVEMAAGGKVPRDRFDEVFNRFVALLDEGLVEESVTPDLPHATGLAVGATLSRVYEEVIACRSEELPSLLPELTFELLVPFLGEERAREGRQRAVARAAGTAPAT